MRLFRLSAPTIILLGLWLALWPGVLAAQTGPGLGSEARVGAALSVRTGATWVDGEATPLGALGGTLRLSSQMELGGEAVATLRPTRLESEERPEVSEISLGYAGLLLRWTAEEGASSLPFRWRTSLHLGAGRARVSSPVVDAEVTSENFFFTEPGIQLLFRQDRSVRLSLEAAYRLSTETERLPELGPEGTRGPSLSLALQLVHDP